jgi:hypothetical protein
MVPHPPWGWLPWRHDDPPVPADGGADPHPPTRSSGALPVAGFLCHWSVVSWHVRLSCDVRWPQRLRLDGIVRRYPYPIPRVSPRSHWRSLCCKSARTLGLSDSTAIACCFGTDGTEDPSGRWSGASRRSTRRQSDMPVQATRIPGYFSDVHAVPAALTALRTTAPPTGGVLSVYLDTTPARVRRRTYLLVS